MVDDSHGDARGGKSEKMTLWTALGFFLKTITKYPGAEGDGTTKLRGTIRKWGLVLGFMLIFWSWSIYKKKKFAEKSKVKKNISKRFFIVGFDACLKYPIMK